MTGSKGNAINSVLLTVVGLLIGLIAGYLIGRGGLSQAPTGSSPAQPTTTICPHELDTEDLYIIAGFRCPGTESSQTLLSDCHCAAAHGIKDMIKSKLAADKTGEQIRAELIAEYGDRLKFAGQ